MTSTAKRPETAVESELPEMLRKIEVNWPILPSGIWNSSSTQLLSRHLLEFTRLCEGLGLERLERLLRGIDEMLSTIIDSQAPPTSGETEALERYLEELRSSIREVRSSPPKVAAKAPETRDSPLDLVYLPAPDEEVDAFVAHLESGGVCCRVLKDPEDLPVVLGAPGTKALLLDASFLGTQEIEAVLHLFHSGVLASPSLLIIADQSTVEMRLRALRAGASHLYSKPIDGERMLAHLRRYIHPRPQPRYRILIVEDDESQAHFAAKLLQKGGMNTLTISDPLGVMDAVARFQPDLILMDLYMPGADGIELTRLIREQGESSSIPVVFLSGEDDPEKKLLTLHAGADDFLTKPVRPQQLLATVQTRIERARHIAATARAQETGGNRLCSRRELLARLDLALFGDDGTPAYRALLVVCPSEPPDSLAEVVAETETALLNSMAKAVAPLLRPADNLADLGDARLGLLYQRSDEADVEQLAEQVYETLSGLAQSKDQGHIGMGMRLLDGTEGNAYDQLCSAESSAESAYRQGLQGYALHGEPPPQPQQAVDELSARRQALKESLARDAPAFRKLGFVSTGKDVQQTCELLPEPFPSAADEDPYRAAAASGLAGEFDRYIFRGALQALGELVMRGSRERLIFRQSAAELKEPDYLEFIKQELRRRQIVGTGLMVNFDLPSLAGDLMRARALIAELAGLGISVALENFACNETSYKVLGYLRADAVRPHPSLLRAHEDRIRHIAGQLHSMHAEIILPRIDQPDRMAPAWSEFADLIQADSGC